MSSQERQIKLLNDMYNEVRGMREANWLAEPEYGCAATLGQEQSKVEKYEKFRKQLLELNPNYLESEFFIINQYGEKLTFRQAQDIINVKINAFESGNKRRQKLKEQAIKVDNERQAQRLKAQEEINKYQSQRQTVTALKQALAPWRVPEMKLQTEESETQRHERLHTLAQQHQFISYIDSFKEVYQALSIGVELTELKKYALVPEQDHALYSLLCWVDKFAIFQGTERNSSPGSNFSRLIAVVCNNATYYERFSILKNAVYAIKDKRRFRVKISTEQDFQLENAEQEILIYEYIGSC